MTMHAALSALKSTHTHIIHVNNYTQANVFVLAHLHVNTKQNWQVGTLERSYDHCCPRLKKFSEALNELVCVKHYRVGTSSV